MNQLSTKEKIIAQSLLMFNQKGVENITTRHIAKELGISQGNLHYHYPNKNEILELLFSNMIEAFKNAESLKSRALSPENIFYSMRSNFKIMHDYRVFFQQNTVIWRRLPALKTKLQALLNQKKEEIILLINAYKREGKFRTDISDTQIEFLADQFIFTIATWLCAKDYSLEDHSIDYYSKFLFRIWMPYLQQNEMEKWEGYLKLA